MRSNVGENTAKYRASCDSCNEAGVHCSQTRPSCARCLSVPNRRCVYRRSERSGKRGTEFLTKAEEGNAKNYPIGRPLAVDTSAIRIEAPSNSLSTIDPRQLLQPFPASFPAFGMGSSDLSKGQQFQKDWSLENSPFALNQLSTPQKSPASYNNYQDMLELDENHLSNVQNYLQDPFHGTSDAALGPYSRDYSTAPEPLSPSRSNTVCVSCSTTDRRSHGNSSMLDTCCCNEIIIMQVSSLPVLLLDNEGSTFDVKLVQFQKALQLCAGVLACTCPGKDYTSILNISMLIARIISFFERGGVPAEGDYANHTQPLDTTGAMSPTRSSKFSIGTYEIEGEDEDTLKREVWWLHIKKVESLVAGFKEMVAKMTQQQLYPDHAEVAVWEKIVFLFDQKVEAVKRVWSGHRSRT